MNDKQFIDGLYPRPKSDRAPDFVIGKLSINVEQFSKWVREWKKANPGEEWINVDMTTRKSDPTKGTAVLDTWKPQKDEAQPSAQEDIDEEIPF